MSSVLSGGIKEGCADTLSFSLLDLMLLVKSPRSHKKLLSAAKSNTLFQEPALTVLRKHHCWVYEQQLKYNCAFIALYRTKSKGVNTIAYDGS